MIDALILTAALLAPTEPTPSPTPHRVTAPSRGVPRTAEFAAAHSRLARDLHGALDSLYRGTYFHASQERFRLCVGQREGSFDYSVTGGGGNQYQTTYQFHESNWRRGLTYMMASESRTTHDGLWAEARALVNRPMRTWGRYWVDRAFYTALNYNGIDSGRHHWNGGSHAC